MFNNKRSILLACSIALLTACSGDDGDNGTNGTNGTDGTNGADGQNGIPNLVTTTDVLKTNANIAYAAYGDSHIAAMDLLESVQAFIANPTEESFVEAKEAWLEAREPYGQTEVYRFREGPIDALLDSGEMGDDGDGPEGRINAWPLGEAVIDYVANQVDGDENPENPTSTAAITTNIISDSTTVPTISKTTLSNTFGLSGADLESLLGDERNVLTGYHAIEFLLWGQDLNTDGSGNGDRDASAGQRPYTDFLNSADCTSGTGTTSAANICERRGQYLVAATELLIDDLARLVTAWNPTGTDNHYASFIAGGDESMALILGAMGRLGFGELAGERMNIALLQDSQEDEHSCFSDNTHRDIFLNAKGIQNAYEGKYVRTDGSVVEGAGVDNLLLSEGEVELENQLRAALEETMIKLSVIDQNAKAGIPFDNQIQIAATRTEVQSGISALVAQTDVIEDVIQALNLTAADLRQDTDQNL